MLYTTFNDTVFLNGESYANAFESAVIDGNMLIQGFDKSLRGKRALGAKRINIHIDSIEPFIILYKTLATVGFAGYTNYQTVIGNDYDNLLNLKPSNLSLQSRMSRIPDCNSTIALLIGESRKDCLKTSISLAPDINPERVLMNDICSSNSTYEEKLRAKNHLEIIQTKKKRDYLALSVEFKQSCLREGIRGACWKVGSNDLENYRYLPDENLKDELQTIYNSNLNSARKDKDDVALIVPDETPLASVRVAMLILSKIGFNICPTKLRDATIIF